MTSSPIAQNQLVTINIPKSSLNKDITSLYIICSNSTSSYTFTLISDNGAIICYPYGGVGTPNITPTFTSGNTSGTIVEGTKNVCSALCTSANFPTTGVILLANNYNNALQVTILSQRDKLTQPTTLFQNTVAAGASITSNALDNLSKIISITFTKSNELVGTIILYKLSNGDISRVVYGPNPNAVGILISFTPTILKT